jgi:hypothetical protein
MESMRLMQQTQRAINLSYIAMSGQTGSLNAQDPRHADFRL